MKGARFSIKNRSGILRGITLIFAFALLPCICPSVEAHGFTDVSYGSIYFDAVSYCYDNGIIVGITETQFCPNQDLNRAMFITFLYRMAGEPQEFADVNFTDVPEGRYFTDAVRWGVHEGIVVGMTDTQFAPFNPLNQEMVITFLHRFAKSTRGYAVEDRDGLDSSDSAGISNFAKKAMYWASISGVLYISNNELTPKVTVTRGEAARYLWRFASNVDGIIPGTDDFSFVNDPASSFSVTTHYGITQAHFDKLLSKLTTSEQFAIGEFQDTAESRYGAQGMCYGMSVCVILDKLGKIDLNGNFCRNADTMSDTPRPASSTARNIWGTDYLTGATISWLESAINYYHLSMLAEATVGCTGRKNVCEQLSGRASKSLQLLAREQQNGGLALFSYGFGADDEHHTVVLYGQPSKTTVQLSGKSYYWYPIYDSRFPGTQGRLYVSTDYTSCKVRRGTSSVYEDATEIWYFNDTSKQYDSDSSYTEGFDDDNFETFDIIDIDGSGNVNPNSAASEVMSSAINPNLQDCVYFFIRADGDYTVTNADGESFSYIAGDFTQDMDADYVAFYPDSPCLRVFRVPCSDSYSLESKSGYLSLIYLTAEDSMAVHGAGIEQIEISPDNLSVSGTGMNYSASMILDLLTQQSVRVTGSQERSVHLFRQPEVDSEIYVASQEAACDVELRNFRKGASLAVQSLEADHSAAVNTSEGISLFTKEVQ